ncbi:hypothetical protein HYALB_00003102 [Hymenoscyphus albidus]|uniref:ACT domain-containing protein n=1 Tax=Hymenoscyphus albidus TaxID=595503 RepID=A0A9N9LUN6_9HELO|nr:hypothetical protein HYALB_00003102 [Hymenoscyphus albidus]
MPGAEFILTLSCPDKPGVVHAVSHWLTEQNLNIVDSQQYGDCTQKRFFMRVHFQQIDASIPTNVVPLEHSFSSVAKTMDMEFQLTSTTHKTRVLIMVSKIGHCLSNILCRTSSNKLKIEIPLIISNHEDFRPIAESYGIPFYHLPITAATKTEQEAKILALVKEHNIELIVLARYMQILSEELCATMSGKIINIHHSFLPAFKGAKPYHQAYDRGVKLVGATAHFVTSDLDEGPIIEQNVTRVGHQLGPAELTNEGANVESTVLVTALKWVTEKKVLMNGTKTVVFN